MEKLNSKITKKAWAMILLLFLMIGISNVEKAMIGFASVPIMDELGLSPTEWGLIGSAFYWLFAVSAILGGSIADKFGTKHVITIMVILWAVVQFSTLFIYSLPILLLTRVILGVAEGPSYALAMTAASKWLPREKTGTGLSLVSIGAPVLLSISAPVCIYLITNFGWRSAFLAAGISTLIWLVFWAIFGKEKPVSLEDKQGNQVISNTAKESFLPTFLSKNFLIVILTGFTAYWSMSVFMSWVPNYFATVLKLGNAGLSLAVTAPALLTIASQLFFSMFSDRLYRKTGSMIKSRVFVMGPVIVTGGLFYLLGSLTSSSTLAVTFLSLGLTLGAVILVLGPTILVEIVQPQHLGKAQGIFVAVGSIGGMVGPYVTGIFIERASTMAAGFHYAFYVMALILGVCGVLVWMGIRSKKEKVELEAITNLNG
ncbi:MFS transporter [Niallia oryzisoli]|uniref:MFS transporter n=1 Tax=Niallia oryzisoli TaxID=1737571 RepID=UPI0037361496